jgi:hypothetical protein
VRAICPAYRRKTTPPSRRCRGVGDFALTREAPTQAASGPRARRVASAPRGERAACGRAAICHLLASAEARGSGPRPPAR